MARLKSDDRCGEDCGWIGIYQLSMEELLAFVFCNQAAVQMCSDTIVDTKEMAQGNVRRAGVISSRVPQGREIAYVLVNYRFHNRGHCVQLPRLTSVGGIAGTW
jgi:hypothetical protein